MATSQQDDDWDLGVDSQATSLVQLKQQLTYFLITGSMAVIGFLATIVNGRPSAWEAALASPTAYATAVVVVAGLTCAGLCLLYLYFGNQSFVLHLKYRYQRKTYEELPKKDQTAWDQLTARSNLFLELSFALLFVEIVAAVIFLWLLIPNSPSPPPPSES